MESADGRSIDRGDLRSDSDLSGPSSPVETSYLDQLAQKFGKVEHLSLPNLQSKAEAPAIDDELDFRLFATGKVDVLQRITLRSPTPPTRQSGFLRAKRPEAYYFSGAPTTLQLKQFHHAAVTGDKVREQLKRSWKGCELPWRVSVVRVPAHPRGVARLPGEETSAGRKRCRKGKKTRIAIRKRISKAQAMKLEQGKELERRAQTEKEKRNARNREKKIKRRQKQRDAKAALRDGG